MKPAIVLNLGAAAILAGLFVALLYAVPVRAQEPPTCQSPEYVTDLVTKDGGAIVGAAYYRGTATDTMLVFETPDAIVIYGFKDGCLAAAVSLEPREKGTPA